MSFDLAKKKVMIADHMLIMTYKHLKDPKLLVAVLDNLIQGVNLGLKELLVKEREFKRIPAYTETTEGMFNVFKEKLSTKMGAKTESIRNISEMIELQKAQKSAPVEFARKKEFIIANSEYRLKTLNEEKLKKHVSAVKELLELFERYANARGF